ncbi:MAG: DUF3108 domain-containing protein [Candidatus Kapaibacterium sp.]
MKKVILFLAFIFSYTFFLPEQSAAQVFQPGEELEYEVSFLGIKLGKIRVVSIAAEDLEGNIVYHAKAFMESYRGIPFVDLNATFESWMDKSLSYSHKFTGNMKLDDDKWQYTQMLFHYDKNEIELKRWINKEPSFEKDIKTEKKVNDGCSLFFLARQFTHLKKSVTIPTIIEHSVVSTKINFHGKEESVDIDAVNYPVSAVYFDGKAEWEGVYGLTGKFEGWFSDDNASVPIKAEMNVYIGKVLIELVRWKREGWVPPRAS